MALKEAKSVQQTLQEENSNLKGKVWKYELQLQAAGLTGSSVSGPHLHALEQEVCLLHEEEGGREGQEERHLRPLSLFPPLFLLFPLSSQLYHVEIAEEKRCTNC